MIENGELAATEVGPPRGAEVGPPFGAEVGPPSGWLYPADAGTTVAAVNRRTAHKINTIYILLFSIEFPY